MIALIRIATGTRVFAWTVRFIGVLLGTASNGFADPIAYSSRSSSNHDFTRQRLVTVTRTVSYCYTRTHRKFLRTMPRTLTCPCCAILPNLVKAVQAFVWRLFIHLLPHPLNQNRRYISQFFYYFLFFINFDGKIYWIGRY